MPVEYEPIWLEVNGFLVGTRACRIADYSQLEESAPRKGSNLDMPLSEEGDRLYPRRPGSKLVQIGLQFDGRYDDEGDPTSANSGQQREDDWAAAAKSYARNLAHEDGPLGIGLESVAFEWNIYGDTLTGTVQVLGVYGIAWEDHTPHIGYGTLELIVPPRLTGGS